MSWVVGWKSRCLGFGEIIITLPCRVEAKIKQNIKPAVCTMQQPQQPQRASQMVDVPSIVCIEVDVFVILLCTPRNRLLGTNLMTIFNSLNATFWEALCNSRITRKSFHTKSFSYYYTLCHNLVGSEFGSAVAFAGHVKHMKQDN